MAKKKTNKSKTGQESTRAPKRIKTNKGIGWVFGPEHAAIVESLLPVIEDIEKFELPFKETVKFYLFSNKGIGVKLDSEQQALMKDTCGFPIKPSELRAFLRQNCNFTDFENATICEILSALRRYAKDKAQTKEKRIKGRPTLNETEEQKRLSILEKWEKDGEKMSRRQFCKREKITVKYFKNCQDWKRANRTNK